MMKKVFLLLFTFVSLITKAQEASDSLNAMPYNQFPESNYKFRYQQLIIPSTMLIVGYIGVENGFLKQVNHKVRQTFRYHSNSESADNYLQYLPLISNYGLSALGAKAKHGYGQRTIALATSYLALAVIVNGLKFTVDAPRPYGSATNSFPSGHTATAFMGAEIIRQEYKESPLYGVTAYAFAATIGYARIYNDRHWFTDVLAGAGAGILSARIGYWLLPYTQQIFQKRRKTKRIALISPFYNGLQGGITYTVLFP